MADEEIDEELGVKEQYADEIRDRMDEIEQGPPSLLDGVVQSLTGSEAEKERWTILLVGAMMEGSRKTARQAMKKSNGNEAVRQEAVALYQDRMVERALDGSLFDALDAGHPNTFREILTVRFPKWAAQKAYQKVSELQDA